MRRAPAVEFEALDPASWSGRDALPRVPPEWAVRQAAADIGEEADRLTAEQMGQKEPEARRAAAPDAACKALDQSTRAAPPKLFVPDLLTAFVTTPAERPNSAETAPRLTLNSLTSSSLTSVERYP